MLDAFGGSFVRMLTQISERVADKSNNLSDYLSVIKELILSFEKP
jgi:hypothetical protein